MMAAASLLGPSSSFIVQMLSLAVVLQARWESFWGSAGVPGVDGVQEEGWRPGNYHAKSSCPVRLWDSLGEAFSLFFCQAGIETSLQWHCQGSSGGSSNKWEASFQKNGNGGMA